MSIAADIAPHLPYLRRFARALAGVQQAADAAVVAFLETLVADPRRFEADTNLRLALYRSFLANWNAENSGNRGAGLVGAAKNLVALSTLPRQAFLLTAVEGFSNQQAAKILRISEGELNIQLDQAGREIAAQVATEVMIIEDEPLIAMDLESLVQELGHRITGFARTHREAIAVAESKRPGLVLADIQLADGSSGLEAVNDILSLFDVPVIFITAFPERLLTGKRPEPTFLISKPFQRDTVKAVISQALFFGIEAHLPERRATA
jgi:DNA-directed RNA polymerase specialized sigma24 family protein